MQTGQFRGISLLSLGLVLALSSPARADVFIPLNDPPSVENLQLPLALQPASPRSTNTYSVTATVGSQGTVANLKTVTMCWFKGNSSASCDDAETNPETQFEMIWTQSTNSFTVTGTNNYRNAGSTTTYGDGSGLTMDVTFTFRVSEAMRAGEDWNVRVTAIDQQDQGTEQDPVFSSEVEANNLPVLFFGAVSTQPSSKSFGSLKLGEAQEIENQSTGSFRANGLADLDISATDFVNGNQTIDLDEINSSPASASVILECNIGTTFGATTPIRIGNAPQTLLTGQFVLGTGEATSTVASHSCQLRYGGGAPVANVVYSNTVTIGIGQGIGN